MWDFVTIDGLKVSLFNYQRVQHTTYKNYVFSKLYIELVIALS